MTNGDDWFATLERLCVEYEKTLKAEVAFRRDLDALCHASNSPVDSFTVQIQQLSPLESHILGNGLARNPTDVRTFDFGRLTIWRREQVRIDRNKLEELLLRLINGYWKPALRDHKSRLISLQFSATYALIDYTLAGFDERAQVLFTDLNNFGKVNSQFGQDGGDEAILQYAAMIDRAARPTAVPIHRSGDEFCALLQSSSADESLAVAERLMSLARETEFKVKQSTLRLTTTIGIAAGPHAHDAYKEIESLAVNAIKPAGQKQRGEIRFSGNYGSPLTQSFTAQSLLLASCVIKTGAATARPFASAALNLISTRIATAIRGGLRTKDLQAFLQQLLKTSTVQMVSGLLQSALAREKGCDVSMRVSAVDVCVSAAHALYNSHLHGHRISDLGELELRYDILGAACLLVLSGHTEPLLQFGELVDDFQALKLGAFDESVQPVVDEGSCRTAVLITIGHSRLELPRSLFSETIVVDDRPSRGGGLPDFWEATIARLVGHLSKNPNVTTVYMLGDTSNAALTAEKLQGVGQWAEDADRMAYKTGISAQRIRSAAEKFAGKIHFCASTDQILEHLHGVAVNKHTFITPVAGVPAFAKPFLERTLDVKEMLLRVGDGCRVETIAKAYPVVIEIVRNLGEAHEAKDQAAVSFRELTDFKVHLTRPHLDQIPAFYESERSSLEEYFSKEFLDPKGTFGKVFHETGQIEPVLKHVAVTLISSGFSATTRRAIIVVPHTVRGDEEVTPLGLVCVRIIPRVSGTKTRVDYTFVWRTVEALVGFPYSLYGSVKFSEYLTGELRAKLGGDQTAVEMGEVSYVAQSLHMFSDEYGQIIARRIVNDASR